LRRFIGTFHKTGTALIEHTLRRARRTGHVRTWVTYEGPEPDEWDVAFERHAHKLARTIDPDPARARYAIVVRDPRDVVVSAAHYHMHSGEKWLHKPRDDFGGMTYQQRILALPDMEHRYLFEIDHSAGSQVRGMLSLPYDLPSVTRTTLEQLVTDHDLHEFRRVFCFLGFSGDTLDGLLDAAERNSLFSGKVRPSAHARDGRPAQWVHAFTPRVTEKFEQVLGDAPQRLGYPAG